ncbi:MAG: fibronectin type III domain-containing protein [Desulfuromonadaceae bacterium]|nr:fibronectin type III domain-containing protein [Desulfuromonadaceae bacterium]
MPLEARLPVAPSQVTLSQRGESLLLGWDIPKTNQDGSELTELKRFDIYRIDYEPELGCPECRNPTYLLQQIDADYYRSTSQDNQRIYMWDHFVEPGSGYRYRIIPINRKDQAGDAATIHRPCFSAPLPPENLRVETADRQVTLRWDAAAQLVDNTAQSTVIGYNIYRCNAGEYFGPRPLNREPHKTTTYADMNLDNGRAYRYTLRTVAQHGEFVLESEAIPAVIATPAAPL